MRLVTEQPALDFDPRDVFDDDVPEPGSDDDEGAPYAELGDFRPAPASNRAPPEPLAPGLRLAVGDCRDCKAVNIALHTRNGGRDRIVCADCAGKSNRKTVERTRETIRALKAAATQGDAAEAHTLLNTLGSLVGEYQAGETMRAIRDAIDGKGAEKGGRR